MFPPGYTLEERREWVSYSLNLSYNHVWRDHAVNILLALPTSKANIKKLDFYNWDEGIEQIVDIALPQERFVTSPRIREAARKCIAEMFINPEATLAYKQSILSASTSSSIHGENIFDQEDILAVAIAQEAYCSLSELPNNTTTEVIKSHVIPLIPKLRKSGKEENQERYNKLIHCLGYTHNSIKYSLSITSIDPLKNILKDEFNKAIINGNDLTCFEVFVKHDNLTHDSESYNLFVSYLEQTQPSASNHAAITNFASRFPIWICGDVYAALLIGDGHGVPESSWFSRNSVLRDIKEKNVRNLLKIALNLEDQQRKEIATAHLLNTTSNALFNKIHLNRKTWLDELPTDHLPDMADIPAGNLRNDLQTYLSQRQAANDASIETNAHIRQVAEQHLR